MTKVTYIIDGERFTAKELVAQIERMNDPTIVTELENAEWMKNNEAELLRWSKDNLTIKPETSHLPLKEAAKYLCISEKTLRTWKSKKEYSYLPYVKIGGKVAYKVSDLNGFILECKKKSEDYHNERIRGKITTEYAE